MHLMAVYVSFNMGKCVKCEMWKDVEKDRREVEIDEQEKQNVQMCVKWSVEKNAKCISNCKKCWKS